tara:strand:- start:2038 stop:2772 length:735 start_codon:yes stop_codon:yes gene_type:complete
MKNISVIIPARFKSSRFPGKPLTKIQGKEMIIRVCEICKKVIKKKNIYVATDDERIIKVVKKFGFNSIKTHKSCLTGTDRVFQAAKKIKSKIIINVQGDEPVIDPSDIKKIINAKIKFPNHVICGFNEIPYSKAENINIPKVVFDRNFDMVYMSRALIPKSKKINYINKVFKQVCIYGFNLKQLKEFSSLKSKGSLEKIEDIELLRFLDLKTKVKMVKVSNRSISVDIRSDIKKVVKFLKNEKN